jgi:phosphotriesterase-related protein
VQTVLGPVEPQALGAVLIHEHAPLVDWSELYETPAADIGPIKETLLAETAARLEAFRKSLPPGDGPGAIVECTPIRVGRYPDLLVELARRVSVGIVACTGFWCEAMAPQHPWALRLALERGGVEKLAALYVREIRLGMEDPRGGWGAGFTEVRAGIIKAATSTYLRPIERRLHLAAALAAIETGCPITTHTTDGGGWEQAQLLIAQGVKPEKIAIGHQGNLDDRQTDDALELHKQIAGLGCFVQFDRVGGKKYPLERLVRQIKDLVDAGHGGQVLLAHDHVPFFYRDYAAGEKPIAAWQKNDGDLTTVTTGLAPALVKAGVAQEAVRGMLVENPRRLLAF